MPSESPYPQPLTAPPPWLPLHELAGGEDSDAPGPGAEGPLPGDHWPKLETVEYVSKLIVLVLLLLALPWLVDRLIAHPGRISKHSAEALSVAPAGA
jgi:hypothetical protein